MKMIMLNAIPSDWRALSKGGAGVATPTVRFPTVRRTSQQSAWRHGCRSSERMEKMGRCWGEECGWGEGRIFSSRGRNLQIKGSIGYEDCPHLWKTMSPRTWVTKPSMEGRNATSWCHVRGSWWPNIRWGRYVQGWLNTTDLSGQRRSHFKQTTESETYVRYPQNMRALTRKN